jgi:long-chain acyl-CoA synthetase
MQVDIELYRRLVRLNAPQPLTLSIIDITPENPRRTIVFLHGFGGNARQWVHQLIRFSDDSRVLAFDLRGHGLSDRPDGPYDVDTLAADIEDALDALNVREPAVLVGHSLGGAAAIEVAMRSPRRVEKLVLIAFPGEFPLALPIRWALALPTALLNLARPFVRRSLSAPPRVLKRMYREAIPWKGWDKFPALRAPTLVIRGHRDRVFSRQLLERVAEAIPDAEEVNVGASGHLVMLERRQAVNRAMERFLEGARAKGESEAAVSLLRKRPWLACYDSHVPRSISVPPVTVDQLLVSASRRFPSRAAIRFQGHRMSYRRLERRSNRLANALIRLGVAPGDRVMVLLPNLPQTVISFYGILKAGAVAAFASPLSEPEELLREIADSEATALITLTKFSSVAERALRETGIRHVILTAVWDYLPALKAAVFRLGRARRDGHSYASRLPSGFHIFQRLLMGESPRRPEIERSSDDLAVLQYTGGTIDLPKAVMLSHRNLVANTLQTRHWIPDVREGREVVLSVLPFSHIYGLMTALCVPVSLAGEMVILSTFATRDVLRAIRGRRPTLFPGVPTMYTAINDFPGARRYRVKSIRACISGAAPLPVEVQEAFERLTKGRLVEGYGLTEASPVTHANPFNGPRKAGSIGIPFPSTEAKIVDLASGKDAGVGKVGELAVRGPQVMKGYWKDPKATSQAITRGGWLLTGDLARMDEDGFFYIVARKKEMILAGEYQVFPRDVEEVLYEHPKVREAAVVGIQPPRFPFQRVKAFVVLRKGERATEEELLDLCRRRLESYAVPWKVEFVDELPKSFVGKVLRRILIERESEPVGGEATASTPSG